MRHLSSVRPQPVYVSSALLCLNYVRVKSGVMCSQATPHRRSEVLPESACCGKPFYFRCLQLEHVAADLMKTSNRIKTKVKKMHQNPTKKNESNQTHPTGESLEYLWASFCLCVSTQLFIFITFGPAMVAVWAAHIRFPELHVTDVMAESSEEDVWIIDLLIKLFPISTWIKSKFHLTTKLLTELWNNHIQTTIWQQRWHTWALTSVCSSVNISLKRLI